MALKMFRGEDLKDSRSDSEDSDNEDGAKDKRKIARKKKKN